jgi:hypothetical protein
LSSGRRRNVQVLDGEALRGRSGRVVSAVAAVQRDGDYGRETERHDWYGEQHSPTWQALQDIE